MAFTITSVTACNALPLIVNGPPEPTDVPIYTLGGSPVTNPALFALTGSSDPTTSGFPAVTFTISLPPGFPSNSALFQMEGACFAGILVGNGGLGDDPTTLTIGVGMPDPQMNMIPWWFLLSQVKWTLLYQGPAGPAPALPGTLFSQTLPLELYFVPPGIVTGPIAIEDVRWNVARDLALQWQDVPSPQPPDIAKACTLAALASPPAYSPRAYYGGYEDFELTDWLFALNGVISQPSPANCVDSAAMCCTILTLQKNPGITALWSGMISPYGYLNYPAVLRGPQQTTPTSLFNYHFVSVVTYAGQTGPFVCDATIGSHVGTENPQQYIADAINQAGYPYAPPPGDPSEWAVPPFPLSQRSLDCPYYVDGVVFNKPSWSSYTPPPTDPRQADFAAAIDTSQLHLDDDRLVPGAIPSPSTCPVMPSAFEPTHERVQYGYPLSRRYWILSDGASALHVRLWISSDGAKSAYQRFLHQGAPGEQGPYFSQGKALGQASAQRIWDGGVERLWIFHNLVFRVTLDGSGIDLDAVCAWLQAEAVMRAQDVPATLPSIDSTPGPEQCVAVGESVVLDSGVDSPYPITVGGARPLLRLVDCDGQRVTLVGCESGTTDISLILTDPKTLLSSVRTFRVTVTD